jgi:hypothetical protein
MLTTQIPMGSMLGLVDRYNDFPCDLNRRWDLFRLSPGDSQTELIFAGRLNANESRS